MVEAAEVHLLLMHMHCDLTCMSMGSFLSRLDTLFEAYAYRLRL